MTIRAIIAAALPKGSRARRIVEECDFNGRPHKVVCREMVLSDRQFYRERALAFDLVAEALQRDPGVVTTADARLVLRLESLYDLLGAGHAGPVRRAAEQTLAGGAPAWGISRLLALKAAACAREGDAVEAALALHQAEERVTSAVERSDVIAARAAGPYVAGSNAEVIALLEEAVRLTEPESVLADPAGLRAHLRHLHALATVHQEDSAPATALRLLEHAQGLLLSRAPDALYMLAALKVETAKVTLCLPGEATRALEEINDALSLAGRIGTTHLQACLEALAAFSRAGTEPADAMAHARLAVELAMPSFGGEELARALLCCARALTLCGDGPSAVGLIEMAKVHCLRGGYVETNAGVRHAAALTLVRRHEEAAFLAERACSRIAAVNHSHYLGYAHLTAATAKAGLGRYREAMEHITQALPLLERAGLLIETKRANAIAARISGEAHYARRAEEIGRLIGAS